jgi:tetratricopeptide (TPR) repeat protein
MGMRCANFLLVFLVIQSDFCISFADESVTPIHNSQKHNLSQSFEHSLKLARVHMLAGKRGEAVSILLSVYQREPSVKVQGLIESYSTQFLNYEAEAFYFEAIRHIESAKWSEAKERLESALTKDPGHTLVLLRLSQCWLMLGRHELAIERVKLAIKTNPFNRDLKIFLAWTQWDYDPTPDAWKEIEKVQSHLNAWFFWVNWKHLSHEQKKKFGKGRSHCKSNITQCWSDITKETKKRQSLWTPLFIESQLMDKLQDIVSTEAAVIKK